MEYTHISTIHSEASVIPSGSAQGSAGPVAASKDVSAPHTYCIRTATALMVENSLGMQKVVAVGMHGMAPAAA